jgi:hypothetical protein
LHPQAPHADRRIRRVRIGGREIQAPNHQILPARENPGLRKLRSRPVRLKEASKADPLRMVAAVAKRHTSRRRKRRNQLACLAARSRPEWQVDYGKDGTSGAILDKRRLLGE